MSKTPKTKLSVALLAVGLLALTAVATTVAADPDHRDDSRGPPQDREAREGQSKERREHAEEMREKAKEKCAEPANETAAKRCEKIKDMHGKAAKARRESHAILRAIHAHEMILGRVDYRIEKVQEHLASGNVTANETAALQERLEKLEDRHDRLVEKIDKLTERLEALKAKWMEVRDHVADKQSRGEGDDDEEDPEEPASPPGNSTSA